MLKQGTFGLLAKYFPLQGLIIKTIWLCYFIAMIERKPRNEIIIIGLNVLK